MPTIQQLSQSMINKIAAGEVIERPASVVKELVENSVDAGATRIDVSVEKGGSEQVRIVDNGCGIASGQLLLALTPHATSKVLEADDLFRINTFGFRGEALASIAEISQLLLRSRVAESAEGSEIRSDGGTLSEAVPCGMPVGTTIEVNNLFFNTPVRRKYMRSMTTEFGHIIEAFMRLALPHPNVHFTLKHNEKIVHDLPAENSWRDRIEKMFPGEIPGNLIPVESHRGEIRVHGYVAHPKVSRSNNRMQYFFLNGRHIRDRALQHALGEAFRGILTVGRFPIAFLQIEMSPELFDVNVHPTKMEVRFLDSHKIYGHFLGTIREKFLSVDLSSPVSSSELPQRKTAPQAAETKPAFRNDNDPRSALDHEAVEQNRQRIVNWAKSRLQDKNTSTLNPDGENVTENPAAKPSESFDVNRAFEESFQKEILFDDTPNVPGEEKPVTKIPGLQKEQPFQAFPPLQMHTLSRSFEKSDDKKERPDEKKSETQLPIEESATLTERVPLGPTGRAVLQMHNRYLVAETDSGLAIIDQHALHERILYEQLKSRFESGKLDSQRLLVPVPLDLAPTETACIEENRELLTNLGLVIEPFGGDTVLISGYPAILEKVDPRDILLGLLDTLMESAKKPDRSDLLEEMLHQMSCKAAMKAGDRLRPEAIERLMELAQDEINVHHCPHGRPSTLLFTCEELDKMFKRT